MERLLTGRDALDLGPAPGPSPPVDMLLDRVIAHLTAAMGRAMGGGDPAESLGLARLAAGVGDAHPQADVFATILWLLDLFEEHIAPPAPGRGFPEAARLIITALILARTPRAVLPPEITAGRRREHQHASAARPRASGRARIRPTVSSDADHGRRLHRTLRWPRGPRSVVGPPGGVGMARFRASLGSSVPQ